MLYWINSILKINNTNTNKELINNYKTKKNSSVIMAMNN